MTEDQRVIRQGMLDALEEVEALRPMAFSKILDPEEIFGEAFELAKKRARDAAQIYLEAFK